MSGMCRIFIFFSLLISEYAETQAMVLEDRSKKGDVLACARVAGIMATKRTSDLIPMCHPLNLTKAKVEIEPIPAAGADARPDGRVGFHVRVTCGVTGKTGIEMEALTGASVACLTIYDMCKAVDRGMEIVGVRLLRKEGGRSGLWERAAEEPSVASPEPQPAATPAPALAFIGYQNAGKTTLVEQVIAELTARGHRVGSLKHHGHHGFSVDTPGKDSWRHAQAGSRHVGLISADRYAEYADTTEELPVEKMLARFTDVDVVIVEGYKAAGLANIVVGRSGADRLRGDSSLALIDAGTIALACNESLARKAPEGLPVLDINDPAAVTDVVEAWLA